MASLARHRLLMLDYDGTLAPFTVVRDEARPAQRTLELLRRIGTGSRTIVAIVSGRPLVELERMIGALPAIFVGEHGWERRAPDGSLVLRPLDPSVATMIEDAERMARASGLSEWLERKRSAIVLHTRSLPPEQAVALNERCVAAWRSLTLGGRVTLDRIDGGVELRASGWGKGSVVGSLLSQSPPETLCVFVGDDVADEDAFAVVRERGFGVRVGDRELPSLAMGRLPSSEAVTVFLERWLEVVEDAAGTAP